MYSLMTVVLAALLSFISQDTLLSQASGPRTLIAVLAHADDEDPAAPIIARYAREGVQVHLLIASDGGQGTGFAAARGDTVPRDEALVRVRTEEARCAAQALGVKPPILLGFPDGRLGDYAGESHARVPVDPTHRRGASALASRCDSHVGTGRRNGASGPSNGE
jgi:LmbE family N-acetylglucosaminyl deacetylase